MLITRPKPIEEILSMLEMFPETSICVVGCGICARKIQTGGEAQVSMMTARLQQRGLDVMDGKMVRHACSTESWDTMVEENPALDKAGILLVMSCGAGVSLLGRLSGKPTLPALDTTSLGSALKDEVLENFCVMCGECGVGLYGGLCPKSGCPKSQVNGPCGGSINGDCEIGGRECIWVKIYERLESMGMLHLLDGIRPPVNHDRRL